MLNLCVIGDPVSHSLSPAMQTAGLRALGMDGTYEARRVRTEELPVFVSEAKNTLRGFNVTVPHKAHILPFLAETERAAALAQSVNTVTVRDGKLYGESTDGYGLEQALLEAFSVPVKGKSFVFLGCGGAAHAAAFYFASCGAAEIRFLNRTKEKAAELAEKVREAYPGTSTEALALEEVSSIPAFLRGCSVLIQCTSLGLRPEDPSPLDASLLPDGICVYDTIYKPTKLYAAARSRGLAAGNGLGMLLHQGARSLERWTNRPSPVEAMRDALEKAYQNTLLNNIQGEKK